MFYMMKKSLSKRLLNKPTKVNPSQPEEKDQIFIKADNYIDMLRNFWVNKPNNFQGPIYYETTFVQGGYTSFVTLPTGHCFANQKRCRTAEMSRQLAARVALSHCMFGGDIFHDEISPETIHNTTQEIIHNKSISNIKCDKQQSTEAISFILGGRLQQKNIGGEYLGLVLKLHLMHWNGSFRKLAQMGCTKEQIAKEVSALSVDHLVEFMTLEWKTREEKQPGTIALELARCQAQLIKATRSQQNVRIPREKCLILLAAKHINCVPVERGSSEKLNHRNCF